MSTHPPEDAIRSALAQLNGSCTDTDIVRLLGALEDHGLELVHAGGLAPIASGLVAAHLVIEAINIILGDALNTNDSAERVALISAARTIIDAWKGRQ